MRDVFFFLADFCAEEYTRVGEIGEFVKINICINGGEEGGESTGVEIEICLSKKFVAVLMTTAFYVIPVVWNRDKRRMSQFEIAL